MGFTPAQYDAALAEHAQAVRFLDAAHDGDNDLTLAARRQGRGRPHEVSVPASEARALIEIVEKRVRALEAEYPIEPWAGPRVDRAKAKPKADAPAKG